MAMDNCLPTYRVTRTKRMEYESSYWDCLTIGQDLGSQLWNCCVIQSDKGLFSLTQLIEVPNGHRVLGPNILDQ